MVEKPEKFFDVHGRQEYLSAREEQILAQAGRRAPAGEVFGVFFKILCTELATILGLMILSAVIIRLEDGEAGWQTAFLGPTLLLVVPLAGTVWTLISVSNHDFSGTLGPVVMRLCVVIMIIAFILFILGCVWVLSLLDPVTYNASFVTQLSWAAVAVTTTIVGIALLVPLTWQLPLWVNLTLSLVLIGVLILVGLLPVFQLIGAAWTDPLLWALRFVGPVLLCIAIIVMPIQRVMLLSENDVVSEAVDRASGDFR